MNTSAMKAAMEKAKSHNSLDPVSWRTVIRKPTPKAMAETLRVLSHRAIKMMEQVYYKHPEHIVQWMLENEKLACGLEECENVPKAVALIKTYKGSTLDFF